MKKKTIFFTLVALVLFALPGCASEQTLLKNTATNPKYSEPQSYDYPNQPDGFNEIPWYSSLVEAEQIKKVEFELVFELNEDKQTYEIPGQGVEIFGVYFPIVAYNFTKNQLVSANIDYLKDPNQESYQKLLQGMVETYGKPTEILKAADGDILIWRGTKTYIHLSHSLEIQGTYIDFKSPEVVFNPASFYKSSTQNT